MITSKQNCLIVCKSLTGAKRAAQCLSLVGISAIVTRLPDRISDVGCGYTVKVNREYLKEAVARLTSCGISYKKVFLILGDGSYSEVTP